MAIYYTITLFLIIFITYDFEISKGQLRFDQLLQIPDVF